MKFHVSCASLSLIPFSRALESVAEKFDGWQIVAEGKHSMDLISKEFADMSQSYDIAYTVHAPFSDINIASLNRAIRLASVTEVASCIRVGASLGIGSFVLHPGRCTLLSHGERERSFLLARESLKSLSALATSLGVSILVENASGTDAIGSSAREMKMLTAGTRAGICLDISHASLDGSLNEFIAEGDSIGMVHLSDNDGRSDGHLPVGTGSLDVSTPLHFIRETGLPVVIESATLEGAAEGRAFLEGIP